MENIELENFKKLYGDKLDRLLTIIDLKRKKKVSFIGNRILILLGIAVLLVIIYRIADMSWPYHFFSVFFIIAAIVYIYGRQKDKYVAEFKATIIPSIIDFISPGLCYYPYNRISESEFNACGLFRSPDRYVGKDYVEGYVGKTHMRFSIVHAEEEHEHTTTDSNGDTHTHTYYTTIFKGLFFSADFNKFFSGCTYVMNGSSGFFRIGNVKLEDPRFNSCFTVNSSDQIEARYILTPNLMERMVEFREKAGKISLAFVGNRIYVAIPSGYNLFEPKFLSSIRNAKLIYAYYYFLNLVIGIVEGLNLNTRIWSK